MTSAETTTNLETKDRPFGPIHAIKSKSEHTHTAVILHGRGSTGEDFAEEFFQSTLSDGSSLLDKLPGCRWVFPSSPELWSTTFREHMWAWFEAHSLTDIAAHQDLQASGIRDSVDYVSAILSEEIRRLDGNTQKLLFGGISQGGAVAIWTLLCQQGSVMRPGAFVVASTWLPFAANIERAFAREPGPDVTQRTEFDEFVEQMIAVKTFPGVTDIVQDTCRLPPVFIGHGVDDAYVDVRLGRHVACILAQAGFSVEWKEYSGAEAEGHWFKVPDEMDDIHNFLSQVGWM
ncbi:Phospholipase/carboxylesterase [Curvularia clavata]|uniref:Phospholipase/carboxylesterase n=1 Tax=Curvularia clavata TaxID=95742 RepID=A0A9Q8ZFQ0_CURCL|nr:Phospholipase/carboxylesterase [Curvularia clavata]